MDFKQFQYEKNLNKLQEDALDYIGKKNTEKNSLEVSGKIYEFIINNIDFSCEFPKCENPKVSIIIPVKNEVSLTKAALNSIYRHTKNIDYEVIIANDKSDDDTTDLDKIFKNIRIIDNKGISGFVYNVKNAVKSAKGEYIFLMNNDMITCENYLTELLNVIEKDSSIGIAGSKNLNIDGTILECGVIISSEGTVKFLFKDEPEDTNDNEEFVECDYCSGCSILFKKEIWIKSGGFDKKLAPAYYEDSDFAFNLKYNYGLKTVCVPKSKIYHFKGRTYEKNGVHKSKHNQEYFLKKWGHILDNR